MSEKITEQKVVLITGCSSGIGLETAIECCKNNMYVFACVRNPNKAFELKKRIEDENLREIKIIEMDVSNDISIKNVRLVLLSDKVSLLTSVYEGKDKTNRSPIWKKYGEDWKIFFHQGTRIKN